MRRRVQAPSPEAVCELDELVKLELEAKLARILPVLEDKEFVRATVKNRGMRMADFHVWAGGFQYIGRQTAVLLEAWEYPVYMTRLNKLLEQAEDFGFNFDQ